MEFHWRRRGARAEVGGLQPAAYVHSLSRNCTTLVNQFGNTFKLLIRVAIVVLLCNVGPVRAHSRGREGNGPSLVLGALGRGEGSFSGRYNKKYEYICLTRSTLITIKSGGLTFDITRTNIIYEEMIEFFQRTTPLSVSQHRLSNHNARLNQGIAALESRPY